MPKIPGSESLGGPSVPRGTRPIITGADTGAGMVGRGIERIGATVSAIGEEERQREDALDLIKADNAAQEGLRGIRRGFETDPDYKTYGPRFDEQAAPVLDSAASQIRNPNTRAKFLERARGQAISSRESVLSRGLGLEREHKEIEVENELSKAQGAYASTRDPAERQRILQRMLESTTLAERTGLVRPKAAERYRDQFVDGTIALDIEERLYDDPEGVLRDLGMVPGGKKPASVTMGPLPSQYVDEIKKSEGFAGRASWDYKQHSVGYGTRARSPGETIDKAEADRRLNDELGKAAAIVDKFSPGLDQGTRAALVSLTFNAGDDWTRQGLGKAIKSGDTETAKSLFLAYNKADGKTLPGLEARRRREASWFGQGSAPQSAAEEPDQAPDVMQFGEPDAPPSPEEMASPTRSQYAMLSGKRRQVMINKARIALSHTYQRKLADDFARVEDGGDEERDDRGESAFDRASRILQPNVLAQWKTKRDKAFLKRDSLRALENMPEDQVDDHIRSIGRDPATGEERADLGYANIKAVRDQAEKQWEKIREKRRKDPAAAVGQSPEVKRAIAAMQGGSGEVRVGVDQDGDPVIDREKMTPLQQRAAATQIVEATMTAQERLGVPKDYQRRISKRQAEKLLDMRNPEKLTSQQQREALQAAAQRASDLFGPEVGEKVFEDALILSFNPNADNLRQYRNRGRETFESGAAAQERFKLIAKQAFGGSVSQQDMGRVQQLERLDAIPPILPRANSGLPAIGQRPPQIPQQRQPSEGHVKLLMQQMAVDPTKAREIFDSKFGEGAAKRVMNRMIEGEAESP